MPATADPDLKEQRFSPADTSRPLRRLSQDQRDQYNRLGYVVPLPVYGAAEAEANRASFDKLLARFQAKGRDSYSINGYHQICASIWDIVTNPLILDYVEDILGENFIAWGSHYFCKLPGDGKAVSWHQDAPYWPLAPTKTVTAWLAIDDADEGNAAMRVIPGSHHFGALRTRASRPDENNVLDRSLDEVESLAAPVSVDMRAGEISLHSDLLVHGSLPNPGPRRRCGLTIRYASADVRADKGWNNGSIICRGSDPSGHWRHHPRPAGESIEFPAA